MSISYETHFLSKGIFQKIQMHLFIQFRVKCAIFDSHFHNLVNGVSEHYPEVRGETCKVML